MTVRNMTATEARLPTPKEVADKLELGGFSEDQAETIAAEVYQPLRELFLAIDIKPH